MKSASGTNHFQKLFILGKHEQAALFADLVAQQFVWD